MKWNMEEMNGVLEGLKSNAMQNEVRGAFMAAGGVAVGIMERRRYIAGMLQAGFEGEKKAEEVIRENGDDVRSEMAKIKLREMRVESAFAADMLPLIDEELAIIERDFMKIVEEARKKDEDMYREECEYGEGHGNDDDNDNENDETRRGMEEMRHGNETRRGTSLRVIDLNSRRDLN